MTEQHTVTRINDDGTDGEVMLTPSDGVPGLNFYSQVGTADWETAERVLAERFRALGWEPGVYRIDVDKPTYPSGTHRLASVTRRLGLHEGWKPGEEGLHPAYNRLPYNPRGEDNSPARAFVRTLMAAYPGATLELIAEHVETFGRHYRVIIGTPELTEETGWTPPADWVRPLSPYAAYHTAEQVPAELR